MIDFLKYDKLFLGRGFFLQALLFALVLLFKKISPETIVYTRNPEVAWLFRKKGNLVVYEAHAWPAKKEKLFRFFLKDVKKIVCNSYGTAEGFRAWGVKNIFVSPNGVDLGDFKELAKLNIREKIGLRGNKKLVVYTGQFYGWKGVGTILSAAENFKKSGDILFVLVGGEDEDIKKYEEVIREKGLENVVLLGHQPQKEIPAYLTAADALLLPNDPEGQSLKFTSPIKMFEYMASGKPIVASNLPSIKEVLDEKTCVFFEAGDGRDLADKINLVLTDKQLSEEISKNSLEKVKQYSWDRRAENIINFIGRSV